VVHTVNPTQLLSLNCLVLTDNKVFSVEVPRSKNVSILKDEIKKKKAQLLRDIDASDLELSQVSLRVDDQLDKSLKSIPLVPLKPLEPLSNLFLTIDATHLHVVVQAPTTAGGEPFQSFSLLPDLIHVLQLIRMQRTKRREIKSALCTKV
jgi:hypothetical protein